MRLDPPRRPGLRFAARVPDFPVKLAVVALALTAGCHDNLAPIPPPRDAFVYPVGVAVRTLPSGKTSLLVVSANADRRYDNGTLLSVDPDASDDFLVHPNGHLAVYPGGAIDLPNFGGEIAVAETSCPGVATPTAVTVARESNSAYLVDLADSGALLCAAGCQVPLAPSLADPFGVSIACRKLAGAGGSLSDASTAFIGFMRTPSDEGWMAQVALAGASRGAVTNGDFGTVAAQSSVFEPQSGRIYVMPHSPRSGYAPIRWLDLSYAFPTAVPQTRNLAPQIPGLDMRNMALSPDGTRASVAAAVDDPIQLAAGGIVPVAAMLVVLDLRPDGTGNPAMAVLNTAHVGLGANQVVVLPRPARCNADGRQPGTGTSPCLPVVAVTCSTQGTLALYDDAVGNVVAELGFDVTSGLPLVGLEPYGLAAQEFPPGSGRYRLFVGSYDMGFVTVVEVDPMNPGGAAVVKRVGRQR